MKKAYETDGEYFERILAGLRAAVWSGWVAIWVALCTILGHFPAECHSPILIGTLILGAFSTGCAYVFEKKMRPGKLATLPRHIPQTPELAREQMDRRIRTLEHKILSCVFTIAISILASRYIEIYRPTQHDYVFDAVFFITITVAILLITWFEWRRLVRLYQEEDRWDGNTFIEIPSDHVHAFERQFTVHKNIQRQHAIWWQFWIVITGFICADGYIGWLYPNQHSDISHMAFPTFYGLFSIFCNTVYRSVTMNQK